LFELLRKKIGGFTEKLKKKVEKEAVSEETQAKEIKEPKPVPAENMQEQAVLEQETLPQKPVEQETGQVPQETIEEEIVEETPEPTAEAIAEEPRKLKAKIGAASKIKRVFGREIEIKETDLKDLVWELELSLLEADVEQTTAEEICREISNALTGKKIKGGEGIGNVLNQKIRETLAAMMETKEMDILKEIKTQKEKPYRILFIGPNGAGKTTSIAKLTHMLQNKGLKVLWSASDTFRAASIEQLEKHAEKLGVRVVKHDYGADPAAVAFDTIKAAQSKGTDVVMIDSAGRQETDRNLMQELQKIERVTQPDLKIYVGESFTGQALLQQAQEYDKIIGIDAFILTKIDCDAKGGTIISLLYKLKKPVAFIGTGQEYKDLQKFEPGFVLKRVIG